MKILAEYRLRPAPRFVGREDELEFMERFYKSYDKRILSVVGIGGSGKTAVVSEFLKRCQRNVDPVEMIPSLSGVSEAIRRLKTVFGVLATR